MQLILKNQSSTIGGETNSSFDWGNLMNNGQSQQYKSKWNLRPLNQLTRWRTSTAALLIFVTTITSVGCVKNLAKYKFPIWTQKPALHPVLSRIYALSSENFLGLNLGLCKKNTNIRYGWTFNVSNLIVDLIAMFCPEIWTFWGLTHIQFFSLARSNTATIFFSWKEFSPCLQNSCDKVELSKTFRL